jgi:hypothetical protein
MSRPPQFPVEDELRIVLSVLSGEMTIVEAARRYQTSEQSGGRRARGRPRSSTWSSPWWRSMPMTGRAGVTARSSG